MVPDAHASGLTPPGAVGGSISYGPAFGTQPMTGRGSTTAKANSGAFCFAELYAWKQISYQIGAYSFTDCTPGAYEIQQTIWFDHCILYINGCAIWYNIATRNCDTGTGGIYTEAYCPPNPNYNIYINGIGSGWLMRAHLKSCSNIITAGWYCGWSEWDVQF